MSAQQYIIHYKDLNKQADKRLSLGKTIYNEIEEMIHIRYELAIVGELDKIL